MTITVATINRPDPAHLADVAAEMQIAGRPTLRAVYDAAQDLYLALEGSHRLAAALALGLTPRLLLLADDAPLTPDEIGYDDMGWFDGAEPTAGLIRDRIARPAGTYQGCPLLSFGEIEIGA